MPCPTRQTDHTPCPQRGQADRVTQKLPQKDGAYCRDNEWVAIWFCLRGAQKGAQVVRLQSCHCVPTWVIYDLWNLLHVIASAAVWALVPLPTCRTVLRLMNFVTLFPSHVG